jgi:eukaryotic-like serine/threonine-protein kinase
MRESNRCAEEARLAELLAGYDEALAGVGLPPGLPIPPADVPPEIGTRLEEDLACLRLLDQLRPRSTPGPAEPASHEDADIRYELDRLHATGGIGRVWRAWDNELGREVALKELLPERAADPALVARFLHEARITGRLQHPGIVPVYEMVPGDDGGPAFYTMRLVRGCSLTAAVRQYHRRLAEGRPDPVDLIRLLNAFVSVCNTVAYAHTQGVIHRDLKGQNVVLGDFGEVVVLDWGFAKERPGQWEGGSTADLDASGVSSPELTPEADQTQAGQLLGTPAYMAPEQAEGRLDEIDARTDVFGLGACLYEILTGQPPFVGSDTAEVLRKARTGEAPSARAVCSRVPVDLSAVCSKAMARRPADRYPLASDLAREVQHWLADEPTEAYPERLLGRVLRWARHHKAGLAVVAATAITTALAAGVGLALVGEAQSRAARAETRAEAERGELRAAADAAAKRRLEEQLYYQRVALAERELAASDLGRAAELLAACPQRLRGWEWHYLKRRCLVEPRVLRGHAGAVSGIALSTDGRLLASAGHDHLIKLWDPGTGRHLDDLVGHTDVVYDIALSPDGRLLASASWDHTVRLWDIQSRREVRSLTGHQTNVFRVAFSSDGLRIASVGSDQRVLLHEAATGRLLGAWSNTPLHQIWRLAFTPDGAALALTTTHHIVFLDALTASRVQRQLAVDGPYVKCIAFSADGRLLATGEGDLAAGDSGRILLWDAASGDRLYALEGHSEPVFGLAFSPDGSRLFSISQDRTAKVWDLTTRQEALTLRGHGDTVRGLALGPNGHFLATASADGTIRLWDATPTERSEPGALHTLSGHAEPVFSVGFHPDGRRAFSLDLGATVRGWDVSRGVENALYTLRIDQRAFSLAVSPDGRFLAVGTSSGRLHLINLFIGQMTQVVDAHEPGPIKGLAFSPDGKYLASAGWDRMVGLTDLSRGETRMLRGHRESVLDVAFTPDGSRLASASYDGTVRVWDTRTGTTLRTLLGDKGRVRSVAFSHSGKLLASGGLDGTIRVWETAGWEQQRTLAAHTGGVNAVAFSPDDLYLTSASDDGTVKVWDVAVGREVQTYHGHAGRVNTVAFSPDGRLLLSGGQDKAVRVWTFHPAAEPSPEPR